MGGYVCGNIFLKLIFVKMGVREYISKFNLSKWVCGNFFPKFILSKMGCMVIYFLNSFLSKMGVR